MEVVCNIEQQLLKLHFPGCKHVPDQQIVSLGAQASSAAVSCLTRCGIIFIGNHAHSPNGQAIAHLLRAVVPLLIKALPSNASLDVHMMGFGTPPDEVQALVRKH